MSDRIVRLTVSPSDDVIGIVRPDNGGGRFFQAVGGPLEWPIDERITGGGDLLVTRTGYQDYRSRCILPLGAAELVRELPDGTLTTDPLALVPAVAPGLRIVGDSFYVGDAKFYVKGSTDFRLPERVGAGIDITPIVTDRTSVGCNWFRLLAMKGNNTGWAFDPRRPDHADVLRRTFDVIGLHGAYVALTVFADTKLWTLGQAEQAEVWERTLAVCREYPFVLIDRVNEEGHPTQLDVIRPSKPAGILSSNGSHGTDEQPPDPLWDYAPYHARRTPGPPNAKPFNNLNPYEFHPDWPHICPYLCEESVKPENYDFSIEYARQMGKAARLGPGAVFHHSAWNDARIWTAEERACAEAFYAELS